MKKYRVVRMVVQVQATITQRRGGPTTLVTGDACSIQENNNKPTATPPSISRFLAAMNHSHHLKRITLFCCSSRLQLSANLYSVDWLDGQSTCPIYANERISWNAFMSHNKALTYESNQSWDFVNYCSLVFSIFSEAWDGFTPQSSIFTQCLTRQEVQNKWSRSWAYFSLFLSSRLKFIVSRATNSRQEKKTPPAINTLGQLFSTAVIVIMYLDLIPGWMRGFSHVQSSQRGSFKKAGVFFKKETVRVTSSPAFLKTWTWKAEKQTNLGNIFFFLVFFTEAVNCEVFLAECLLWWNMVCQSLAKNGNPR